MFLMFLISPATADRGMISLTPAILEESEQNAIIAWNGSEEILILSTTVRASNNTTVLEILPLPSKPEIKKADIQQFHQLIRILNMDGEKMGGFGFAAQRGAGFEIIFQERIGFHYLTVILVRDPVEFSEWFEDFVAERGFSTTLPEGFAAIISDYTSRGYNYFVIDLINVSREQRSVEPIQYRFKSEKLYYPLKITSTIKSYTRVNLFILGEGEVRNEDLEKAGMWKGYKSSVYTFISKSKLMEINPEIAEILDGAYFTNARFGGETNQLENDLEVSELWVPGLYEHLVKAVEGTTIYFCLSALGTFQHVGGIDVLFFSIIVFSPILGFPTLFLIVYRGVRTELNVSPESRRILSYIIPPVLTIFVALLPGIFAAIAMFMLFFLGLGFALYIAFKAVGIIFRTES
ncbi:MAG: DUF2330 domain-containing protein [Archaeoglobus sp.]|nr:DUF2330 domain-containing protein [Archaeoglobus sp.]